jgi:hypothetical protein
VYRRNDEKKPKEVKTYEDLQAMDSGSEGEVSNATAAAGTGIREMKLK